MSSAVLWPEGRAAKRRSERTSICTEAEQLEAAACRSGGVSAGGRLTLGQLLDGVWEGLRAGEAAECPVCQGTLSPLGDTAIGRGRCGECGTTLS